MSSYIYVNNPFLTKPDFSNWNNLSSRQKEILCEQSLRYQRAKIYNVSTREENLRNKYRSDMEDFYDAEIIEELQLSFDEEKKEDISIMYLNTIKHYMENPDYKEEIAACMQELEICDFTPEQWGQLLCSEDDYRYEWPLPHQVDNIETLDKIIGEGKSEEYKDVSIKITPGGDTVTEYKKSDGTYTRHNKLNDLNMAVPSVYMHVGQVVCHCWGEKDNFYGRPAVAGPFGAYWYRRNKLHNIFGPAVVMTDGIVAYYILGILIKEFKDPTTEEAAVFRRKWELYHYCLFRGAISEKGCLLIERVQNMKTSIELVDMRNMNNMQHATHVKLCLEVVRDHREDIADWLEGSIVAPVRSFQHYRSDELRKSAIGIDYNNQMVDDNHSVHPFPFGSYMYSCKRLMVANGTCHVTVEKEWNRRRCHILFAQPAIRRNFHQELLPSVYDNESCMYYLRNSYAVEFFRADNGPCIVTPEHCIWIKRGTSQKSNSMGPAIIRKSGRVEYWIEDCRIKTFDDYRSQEAVNYQELFVHANHIARQMNRADIMTFLQERAINNSFASLSLGGSSPAA